MKKIFLGLCCIAPLLLSCSFDLAPASSSVSVAMSETETERVYAMYKANGGNLSYQEWLASIKGEPGADGTSIRSGRGVPQPSLGRDGDVYIDFGSFDFYVRASGSWFLVEPDGLGGAVETNGTWTTRRSMGFRASRLWGR